jgi:ubiquinone/menaquinone biosynthesis C-methylase UbiE
MKYENLIRLAELNPSVTLEKIGLRDNHTVCDIGAGSGIFTLPAAKISNNKVYALEINDEMLSIIGDKAKADGSSNIELVKVKGEIFDLADDTIDIFLMVTVLHEIKDRATLMAEVKRIINKNGRLAIIEFHKRETPMGPTINHRIGKEETIDIVISAGFMEIDSFDLGDNFYCLVFSKCI